MLVVRIVWQDGEKSTGNSQIRNVFSTIRTYLCRKQSTEAKTTDYFKMVIKQRFENNLENVRKMVGGIKVYAVPLCEASTVVI